MAEKKTTRADAVAAGTKKPAAKKGGKSTPPKKKAPEKVKKGNQDFSGGLAPNVVIAVFSVILLILFVVIAVNPDGALLRFLKSVILGLLGQAGFYFSIPALLYLFIIQTLGRKHSPTMRSVCLVLFVFFSGSIFHLVVQDQGMAEGLAVIPDLYTGGPHRRRSLRRIGYAPALALRKRDRLPRSDRLRGPYASGLHGDHHSQHYPGHRQPAPGGV